MTRAVELLSLSIVLHLVVDELEGHGLSSALRSPSGMAQQFFGLGLGMVVNVLQSTADLHRQCASLGRLSESDGQAEGRGRYNGTEDRALLRLRNDARRVGANVLVVLDKRDLKNRDIPLDEVAVDSPHCKSIVWITADAYMCPEGVG